MTRRPADDGSAVVEFVALGLLLLIPVVYLVIAMGRIQAAALAADGSARAAGRSFVTAATDRAGRERAAAAVRLGLADQGFAAADGTLRLECSARPCLRPQARVVATVEVRVALPGVPGFVDRVAPARVTVRATQVLAVDAFRIAPGRRTAP